MQKTDLSFEERRRQTWKRIAPGSDLGTETDGAAVKGVRVDPRRLNTQSESQRSSERGALVSYFRDIAEIPTLTKEQEVLLAKEIESATLGFREGMMSIPWTPAEAVRIWQGLKAEGRATGKMCESFGSGSPEGTDLGARIDSILSKMETPLRASARLPTRPARTTRWSRSDRRIARLLKEADLSMQLLGRMRKGLLAASPRGGARAPPAGQPRVAQAPGRAPSRASCAARRR